MTPTELRRQFLIEARAYETDINDLLRELQRDIERASVEYSNDMDGFATAVSALIVGFYTAYTTLSVNRNHNVAKKYAKYVDDNVVSILDDAGATKSADKLRTQTKNYPTIVFDRFRTLKNTYDNKTFDQRIVTLKKASDQMVRKIVARGIVDGRSVNDVARSIENYIDPTSQSGRRYTRGNGVNYKAVPLDRRLPKAAIKYNAVRIARSEIMQTYQRSTGEFYDGKQWNRGFRWKLSNSHRGKDICDINAARTYKTYADVPKRHPQCMCDIQPIPITLDQLAKLVSSGAID